MLVNSLDQALARSQAFIRERRLTQHERRKVGGKELADALASMGPDIDGPEACPAEWGLPQWFLWCVSTFFFRQTQADAVAWWTHAADGEAPLLKRASALPAEAWWAVNDAFKIACVRDAIASAEPVCRDKDYWPQVTAAAQQVCDALAAAGDLEAAYAKAEAVRISLSETALTAYGTGRSADAHAAYAGVFVAEAAIWAVEAAWAVDDTRGAADAAVCAANAAWCADGAPYVPEGSTSAESATFRRLANMLLDLIETEFATGRRSTTLTGSVGCVDDSRPVLRIFRQSHSGAEETEDHGIKRTLNPMPASALFPIKQRRHWNLAWWGRIGAVILIFGGFYVFDYLPIVGRDQRMMPLVMAVLLMALGAAILLMASLRSGNDSAHERPNVAGAEAERMLINRQLASRR